MSNGPNLSWQEALDELRERNARYVVDKRDGKLQDSARREELVDGQHPFAVIVSCADSRVVPELVFDAGLGELFVIRVAGNVANTSSIASVEYAVAHLGVQLVVVMGHQSCGAVTAAIGGGDHGDNLNHLLALVQPAIDVSNSNDVDTVVRENARTSAQAFVDRSTILEEAVAAGTLRVVPAYYALDSGQVELLE